MKLLRNFDNKKKLDKLRKKSGWKPLETSRDKQTKNCQLYWLVHVLIESWKIEWSKLYTKHTKGKMKTKENVAEQNGRDQNMQNKNSKLDERAERKKWIESTGSTYTSQAKNGKEEETEEEETLSEYLKCCS